MKQGLVLAVAASLLASCGAVERLKGKKGFTFEGHQFRARAQKEGDDRVAFSVTVRRASQSVGGAAQAGNHAGVTYCIENYGRSDIDWAPGQGPFEENVAARIADDQITFRGRCQGWP